MNAIPEVLWEQEAPVGSLVGKGDQEVVADRVVHLGWAISEGQALARAVSQRGGHR